MARLLSILTLAALETTVVSLPLLVLTSLALPWPLLFLIVLLGLLADGVSLRAPRVAERPVLGAGAGLAVLLLLTGQIPGGLGGALGALLPGSSAIGLAYLLCLAALFLYWRGTRVASRDSVGVSALFGRSSAIMLVSMLIGPLLGLGAPLGSGPVLAHIVGFISLGLMALALAHAEDDPVARAQRLSWRWLLTLGLAIGSVVLIGVLIIAAIGGGTAMEAAQNLLRLMILPFAIIGGLIAYLLVTILAEPLTNLLRLIMAQLGQLQLAPPPQAQATNTQNTQGMLEAVSRLANGATFLMALIPLAIMVALILILRGRARRPQAQDEERESLGVAASLAGDLRDLLGRLRNPFARQLEGLQAALAALRGDDPAIRVRRAYVRFLLRLEARERPRPPAETPAELAVAVAEAPLALATLTGAYEQARYNPAGVAAAQAESAEQALDTIARADQKQRGK